LRVLVHVVLFISYAVFNAAAMAAVKDAGRDLGFGRRAASLGRLALGGALYAAALIVLVALLRRGDASSVFPIAIGCTVLATNAVGARFYGEHVTRRKIAGTALLLAGIALIFFDARR
jgi:drug/metabolite transporter (DMT)-like permease